MKPEDRKAWEKEQRRNRIVEIAEPIIFQKGIDGVTIDEIAAAAGYSKRSIYLYFKDKDEIFLAVVCRGQKIFVEYLSSALDDASGQTAVSNVMSLGKAFYNFSIEHPEYFSLIMQYESRIHVYHGTADRDDDFAGYRALCQDISNRYGLIVTEAIESDIKNNKIKTTLEPRQLMLVIWGQVFGIMQVILMRTKMFKDAYGITHEELFEEFLRMAEKGLQ